MKRLKKIEKILEELAISRKKSEAKNEKENKNLRDFLDNLSIKQAELTEQIKEITKYFEDFTKRIKDLWLKIFTTFASFVTCSNIIENFNSQTYR